MTVTVKVEGAAALEKSLRLLGDAPAARRTAQRALRQALEPVREQAVQLAPDDPATGSGKFLRESIKIGTAKRSRVNRGQAAIEDTADQVWMVLGIDQGVDPPVERPRQRGEGSYRDPGVAGVSVIIEFGRDGVAAVPFMRGAWDAQKAVLPARAGAVLGPEIEKTAARLAKKRLSPVSG